MNNENLWVPRRKSPADPKKIRRTAQEADTDLLTASILDARGIDDPDEIRAFLNPSLKGLYDPALLPDIQPAVGRILQAAENGEKIWIYADYDADGTCAGSILKRYFQDCGIETQVYTPNRLKEGYGMNIPALESLKEQGASLIVTVDNGIASVREAEWLKENGIDLIVTDHHEPQGKLPEALAVIDPKRGDSVYPYSELCGAGLAFKLVQALDTAFGADSDLTEYLQLAAAATVADLVPLRDENRVIASVGIDSMNEFPVNPGLAALIEVSQIETVTAGALGFRIGPMLNAPGRLGEADKVIALLAGEDPDPDQIEMQAKELFEENEERKQIEERIVGEAKAVVEERELWEDPVMVLSGDGWHSGVIGIAASRLQDIWYRPVVIAGGDGEILRGSCRSIEGFNIFEALSSCAELFENYGGHEQAAGFSIRRERMPLLRDRLCSYARETDIEPLLSRRCRFDCRIRPVDCDETLTEKLAAFEPCGIGNPAPVLLAAPVFPASVRRMGREDSHLSFKTGGLRCVGFGLGNTAEELNMSAIAVLGRAELNCFNGSKTVQFNVKDLKASPFEDVQAAAKMAQELENAQKPVYLFSEYVRSYRPKAAQTVFGTDRDKCAAVFTVLRRNGTIETAGLLKASNMTPAGLGAALAVLRSAGLIEYDFNGAEISAQIVPQNGKTNIEKNRLYRIVTELDADRGRKNGS